MQNTGTLISSSIRPNNTSDLIATAYAVEVKGGHHSYALITDRDSIIKERREWGMICTIYNDIDPLKNGTYQLKYGYKDNTITNNLNWVKFVTGGSGSGSTDSYWLNPIISVESVEYITPTDGDRYLLGDSPSGSNWGSLVKGDVVEWDSVTGVWVVTKPKDGMSVRVNNQDNIIFRYDLGKGFWVKEKGNQVLPISANSSNGIIFTATSDNLFTYQVDTIYIVQFATANSGTTLTLNINGLGVKTIKNQSSAGLTDFVSKEINPSVLYNLQYDGTYFRLTKPSSDPTLVRYSIRSNETVIVPAYQEYLVYGDLEVKGNLNIDTNGKVVVINGALNVNGGTVSNSSNVQLVNINGGLTKYSTVLGMSSGVTYSVTHGLNTPSVLVNTWDDTTGELIIVDVVKTSNNSLDINSTTTLTGVRIVVIG